MNFLLISIIAYISNAGSTVIDKILLKKTIKDPIVYTFYINVLQLLVVVLIPFGFVLKWDLGTLPAILSGVIGIAAFYCFFRSLKDNEASIVAPVVGTLNPLFTLVVGGLFLGQTLTQTQYLAFGILTLGTVIMTFNLWAHTVRFGNRIEWMAAAGFFFALSYVFIREAFLGSSFINGMVISRISAGLVMISMLAIPSIRHEIFTKNKDEQTKFSKTTLILMGSGQAMGGIYGLLVAFAISLASPALVNSLFGVQYITILIISLLLVRSHPHLLDEKLSKIVIIEKLTGAGILSFGLYLLAQ